MARLKVKYTEEVAPALFKKFGYKSTMQIPKIDKVVVNVGCGEARENAKVLDAVCGDLATITGQKAIVTGGTRGLGRAIAEAYHEQGAEVVIISTTDACHKAAAEIASDGGAPVHGVVCDLSNRDALRRGFQAALELRGGRLDLLYNNAGINRNHKSQDFPE